MLNQEEPGKENSMKHLLVVSVLTFCSGFAFLFAEEQPADREAAEIQRLQKVIMEQVTTIRELRNTIGELGDQITDLQDENKRLRELAGVDVVLDEAKKETAAPDAEEDAEEDADKPTLGLWRYSLDEGVLEFFQTHGYPRPPFSGGLVIKSISMGGPGHLAGLKIHDVITAISGVNINKDFPRAVRLSTGRPMTLSVFRFSDGKWKPHQITITPMTEEEMLGNAKASPLSLETVRMKFDIIGQRQVNLIVKNVSPQDIMAYTVEIHCYDRFGKPVRSPMGDSTFRGISQSIIKPGQTSRHNSWWTLHWHDNAVKIKVVLTKAQLEDGSQWTPNEEEVAITAEFER